MAQARAAVAERMMGRLGFVGSNDKTEPLIEASFAKALGLIEAHLASRPYLLGGRPAMADFGLWAQLYEAATDPTPGAIMRASAPNVMGWIQRMVAPQAEGDFEPHGRRSRPTLTPLLTQEVGTLFLPWSAANAAAIARGEQELHDERSAARRGRRSRRSTMRARWPRFAASSRPPKAARGS